MVKALLMACAGAVLGLTGLAHTSATSPLMARFPVGRFED
jgi:hypothetical protein